MKACEIVTLEKKINDKIDNKFNEIQDLWKKYKHYQIINKQIDPSFTYREINDFLVDFYTNHANSFKINLGLGYVLYHTITNEYKYFYVSTNNLLLDKAVPIINRKDISDLMKHIVDIKSMQYDIDVKIVLHTTYVI